MKLRESWTMARGQIAWILALVVSTAIIIRLEGVEFQDRLSALERNPLAEFPEETSVAALDAARAAHAEAPDDPLAQAQLLTALTLAALSAGPAEFAPEAREVLASVSPGAAEEEPLLDSAVGIAEIVFAAP